jgi:hypothetical protein
VGVTFDPAPTVRRVSDAGGEGVNDGNGATDFISAFVPVASDYLATVMEDQAHAGVVAAQVRMCNGGVGDGEHKFKTLDRSLGFPTGLPLH